MNLPENPLLAVDGDSLLYRCGFAAQKTIYMLEDGPEFTAKKDMTSYLESLGLEDAPYSTRLQVEPVENALANVKSVMETTLEDIPAEEFVVYLSSNTPTFRDDLATIKGYKENRKDQQKPVHYMDCKKYIMDYWRGEEVFGIEADDALGIHQIQHLDRAVMSTNDKDLNQIPGWHYNWTKDPPSLYYIDEDEALMYKYVQVLAGDSTDNIEGIPGVGTKSAERLLRNMFGSTEEEYDNLCLEIYEDYFNSSKNIKSMGIPYNQYLVMLGKSVQEIYQENKALITILTKEQENVVEAHG